MRFCTDSPLIALRAEMHAIEKMPHFALTGSAGFDLYTGKKEEFYKPFTPPFDLTDGYESVIHFDCCAEREITINFPLYSSVSTLYIGLEQDAILKKAEEDAQ